MTLQTYKLADNLEEEINAFEQDITRFKKGEMSPTELKVIRVPFGVYEQRKKDTYMVRIRCGGSIVTPAQLKRIAEISREHSASYIHLTTRQEIQLHYVLIDSVIPVVRALKEIGMSSRGGGGNTVRNIVAQEDAGIAKDDVFDVSPYAIALTSRFVSEPDSWQLPRKFKVAFSGSAEDRGYATIHDVGFIAKIQDGKKGFKVYFAGGLGAKTQIALKLFDFIPEEEVYNVARAIKNLFHKNGNRKNKHAARLRFLVKTMGEEKLKEKFFEEYELVKAENYPPLDIQEIDNSGAELDLAVEEIADTKDFELWQKRFVIEQKQEGLRAVIIPAHLGHVDNDNAIALAEFLMPFGDNTIRIRKDQNFLIRNIPEKYLPNFYNFLKKTFSNFNRPFIIDKAIACAGASTCQLGICLSPGAATATQKYLQSKHDLDLDAVSDAKINISGCPNSCGQHHVGDIGFFGKVARIGDKVYPAYNVVSGALIGDEKTELAQKIGEIASRDLPRVVHDIIKVFTGKKDKYKNFTEFMRSEEGKADLAAVCTQYKQIPEYENNKNYYYDWGTDKIFSVAERGKGECSAGIFDLIESDFGHIQQARKLIEDIREAKEDNPEQIGQFLKDIVFYSSRVLLISQALDAKSEVQAFDYFIESFVKTGLVNPKHEELINLAKDNKRDELLKREEEINELADRMKYLYDVMDPSFVFKIEDDKKFKGSKEIKTGGLKLTQGSQGSGSSAKTAVAQRPVTAEKATPEPALVKDFRGVGCPMNFVKTKIELAKLKTKDILEIWLDDGPPIENVPGSVRSEGHNVLDQKKADEGYWKVLIEKN